MLTRLRVVKFSFAFTPPEENWLIVKNLNRHTGDV
jgi:hypothetical protein